MQDPNIKFLTTDTHIHVTSNKLPKWKLWVAKLFKIPVNDRYDVWLTVITVGDFMRLNDMVVSNLGFKMIVTKKEKDTWVRMADPDRYKYKLTPVNTIPYNHLWNNPHTLHLIGQAASEGSQYKKLT